MTTLTVGSAVARRGEKASGFIDVPAGSDPGTRIPVTVVNGEKDGPCLALVAGIHGSEPSPILALQRVRAELDPARLSGSVVMVHVANLPSFVHRTIYRGPWDQKNLNRVFPGSADGTASERIAHAITTSVIDRCDALIDMHSGDGNEDLRPYSYWNCLGADTRVDAAARDLALAFGIDHIVIDRGRPRDVNASVFCSNTAHVRGKPAVTTEAGGVGVPSERAVATNTRGALGVMRHLGMIAGPRMKVRRPVWIEPSEVLTSPGTGLWYPAVTANQRVRKGARLGHLTDYFGATTAVVKSPLTGVVLYIVASPAMTQGEPIGMVGAVKR
jgi:predicted deacylase